MKPEAMTGDLFSAGDIVTDIFKPPQRMTRAERLFYERAGEQSILYQHSVLCQTCLPYRNPGELGEWRRKNGRIAILIEQGKIGEREAPAGLPYGPKPRLVMFHLNAEIIRTQCGAITIGDSLTAFAQRLFGPDPGGRTVRTVRDQLGRIAAARYTFRTHFEDGHEQMDKEGVITALELWAPRSAQQSTLWPTRVRFSQLYYESLMAHAVPLDEAAVGALSHSPMALDVYAWLAQRLHRVGQPVTVPWAALHQQFGEGFRRERAFREHFLETLMQVTFVYPDAKLEAGEDGLTLRNSAPPVRRGSVTQ